MSDEIKKCRGVFGRWNAPSAALTTYMLAGSLKAGLLFTVMLESIMLASISSFQYVA
jgi:hypothetical protein